MHDVPAFLKDVDLGGPALRVLELIHSADLCFVGLIVSVLICLGGKMVSGKTGLFRWGLRLAALVFLIHGGVSYVTAENAAAADLGVMAARSGLFAGLTTALLWIVFPVVHFVYAHLRLGLTAFLLYAGYAIIAAGRYFEIEQLPGIALRAVAAAAVVIIIAWIFQPLWDLLAKRFGKPAAEPPADQPSRAERKRRRSWLRKKRRRMRDELGDDDEVHTMQIEMRRRRDKARLTVELTYAMTVSENSTPLPRDMFESWINRYLGDHLPPEDVEENSRHLQEMLAQQKQLTQQLANPTPGTQLEDLNHWFLDEQRRIQNDLQLDLAEKQTKLLDLQQMYTSLVNRMLRDQQNAVVPLPYRPTASMPTGQSG